MTRRNAGRLSNWTPANTCAGTVPGVPVKAGAELLPVGVKPTVPFVGTEAGHATVPAGVIDATPPAGLAVTADTASPVVGIRAEPPVAVEVITWVPVTAAVVPP